MNLRALSLVFGAGLVAAELLSARYFELELLLLCLQLFCGLSVGILMGATSRLIAQSHTPDQLFGFVDMMAVLLMSFMVAGAGFAIGQFGIEGGYLFAAGVAIIFTALMTSFAGNDANNDKPREQSVGALLLSGRAFAVVFMGVLFVTASGLGFAFMFTLAINLGMEYGSAGTFIGTLLFVSALACHLGGWCSARFGPTRPLTIAFIVCGAGWWLAVNADTQIVFMIGLVPAIFSLQFNFPILLALSGSLDSNGRWASIAAPIQTSGFAWAAISAGFIVDSWGLYALGYATILGMSGCLLLLFYAQRFAKQPRTEAINLLEP